MIAKQLYKILIGIDPGVSTGFAVYDRTQKKLISVATMNIIKAQVTIVSGWILEQLCQNRVMVRVEDARLRKYFGKADREVLQGAGSIKRDCSVWEEFLTYHSIPFEFVAPKNNKTKTSEIFFKKTTGYLQKTSEHGRDAAWLVYGF